MACPGGEVWLMACSGGEVVRCGSWHALVVRCDSCPSHGACAGAACRLVVIRVQHVGRGLRGSGLQPTLHIGARSPNSAYDACLKSAQVPYISPYLVLSYCRTVVQLYCYCTVVLSHCYVSHMAKF